MYFLTTTIDNQGDRIIDRIEHAGDRLLSSFRSVWGGKRYKVVGTLPDGSPDFKEIPIPLKRTMIKILSMFLCFIPGVILKAISLLNSQIYRKYHQIDHCLTLPDYMKLPLDIQKNIASFVLSGSGTKDFSHFEQSSKLFQSVAASTWKETVKDRQPPIETSQAAKTFWKECTTKYPKLLRDCLGMSRLVKFPHHPLTFEPDDQRRMLYTINPDHFAFKDRIEDSFFHESSCITTFDVLPHRPVIVIHCHHIASGRYENVFLFPNSWAEQDFSQGNWIAQGPTELRSFLNVIGARASLKWSGLLDLMQEKVCAGWKISTHPR